jgi:hypothetical protein
VVPRPYYTSGQTWSNPSIPTRPSTIAALAAAALPAPVPMVRAGSVGQASRPLLLPSSAQPLRLGWQGVTYIRVTGYSWCVAWLVLTAAWQHT